MPDKKRRILVGFYSFPPILFVAMFLGQFDIRTIYTADNLTPPMLADNLTPGQFDTSDNLTPAQLDTADNLTPWKTFILGYISQPSARRAHRHPPIVRCQIVRSVKLSAVSNCPQYEIVLVSNCPRCQIVRGMKLSWCQIVRGVKLSAVLNCPRF